LGVHIDGFIAQVAHTIVVTSDGKGAAEGRKADVILAAHNALQAAIRSIAAGAKNNDVTPQICIDFRSPMSSKRSAKAINAIHWKVSFLTKSRSTLLMATMSLSTRPLLIRRLKNMNSKSMKSTDSILSSLLEKERPRKLN
jgi:methionine aminopeptidase